MFPIRLRLQTSACKQNFINENLIESLVDDSKTSLILLLTNDFSFQNVINRNKQLPVIVYIHGGGFFAGNGGPKFTGADYFMDTQDVIFVAMNYRLGPLGFLSTGETNMPGNFGLKDQALAILWIHENIGAFGGESFQTLNFFLI